MILNLKALTLGGIPITFIVPGESRRIIAQTVTRKNAEAASIKKNIDFIRLK
jgi:hypothetical protein